jgi:hypothetical protein
MSTKDINIKLCEMTLETDNLFFEQPLFHFHSLKVKKRGLNMFDLSFLHYTQFQQVAFGCRVSIE